MCFSNVVADTLWGSIFNVRTGLEEFQVSLENIDNVGALLIAGNL
jgi:hypothetical protein